MDCLKVCQLIIIRVYARAEEQSGVSAVYDLRGAAEFDEVRLVFLIAWGNKAVDFSLELDLLIVGVGRVPFGKASLPSGIVLAQAIGGVGSG